MIGSCHICDAISENKTCTICHGIGVEINIETVEEIEPDPESPDEAFQPRDRERICSHCGGVGTCPTVRNWDPGRLPNT
jgi:hypothetical protein